MNTNFKQFKWLKENYPIGHEFRYFGRDLKVECYPRDDASAFHVKCRYINNQNEFCSVTLSISELTAI